MEIDPNELDAKIAELSALTAKYEDDFAEFDTATKNITTTKQHLRAQLQAQLDLLSQQEQEIKEKSYDIRVALRKAKNDLDSAKRQKEAQERLLIQEKAFADQAEKWEKLTAGASWREWAKDHQIKGGRILTTNGRTILADTMGLGKTLTAIVTMDYVEAATAEASYEYPAINSGLDGQGYKVVEPCGRRVIYFCPSTMLDNVKREIRHWSKKRSVVVLGNQSKIARRLILDAMTEHPEYVCVINYEAWRKDNSLIEDLATIDFDTAIIDEAHNIKDRKSNAYRGVRHILDGTTKEKGVVRNSSRLCKYGSPVGAIPFVFPMTGTPILNKPQELYTLLTLVDPVHFTNDPTGENFFLSDYCERDYDNNKWKFRPGGLDSLAKRLTNLYLRRTKDDAGIQLPPKTITVHSLALDLEQFAGQAEAREKMTKWASIVLDDEHADGTPKSVTAMAQLAVYTRLRQIETWPAGITVKDDKGDVIVSLGDEPKYQQSQKLDYILHANGVTSDDPTTSWSTPGGLLPDIVADERVVVFSQFTSPLQELKRRCELAGYRVAMMTGETPREKRDEIAVDFDNRYTSDRAESKYDIVLCNYKVGGVGLNFTAATQMIILDEEWNPGKRDQAYDRIHRMGQDKPVTIHVLRDENTIDDWLSGLIDVKEEMIDGFNDANSAAKTVLAKLKGGLI